MKILLIDNYDSFSFNLYQLLAIINGEPPVVVKNDETTWADLASSSFDRIVISPGPGRPDRTADFGISRDAIAYAKVPLLGVCLGHQGIGVAHGARVVPAPEIVHGRTSTIYHESDSLFDGIPRQFRAVRYHSLALDPALSPSLEAIAWTEDGQVMAIRHRTRPLVGVQFHPESIATEHGHRLLENFLEPTTPGESRRTSPKIRGGVNLRPDRVTSPSHVCRFRRLDRWIDPERTFLALLAQSPSAFWLDSSLVTDGARFSFMGDGSGPLARRITCSDRGRVFDNLGDELARARIAPPDLPFDFHGGFIGYLAYDTGASFVFADRFIAFDHHQRCVYLLCLSPQGDLAGANRWLDDTARHLDTIAATPLPPPPSLHVAADFVASRDDEQYLRDIAHCQAEIRAGESYQLCLTRSLRARATVDALALHRILRRQNPAPYAAFLRLPEASVVCASPERFLKIDRHRDIESRPIKGTAPRGETTAADSALRKALAHSEKDRAENLMIVDLVRNDLGAVCAPGTITVPALSEIETYATVHQMVSTIRGHLREDADPIDAIRHAFPPGSMTGAPKHRTLHILDHLEREPRGIYSGAIGYLSASGPIDLNVVIRTAIITENAITIGTGGAITALSDPAAELSEAHLKTQALLGALTSPCSESGYP